MNIIKPTIFKFEKNIISAVSTREGGISPNLYGLNLSYKVNDERENVDRNRDLFFGELGIPLNLLAIPGQIHGDNILVVDKPGQYPNCDALITAEKNLFLVVTIADCIPILIYDNKNQIISVVHSGWKGSEKKILSSTVRKMQTEFNSKKSDLYCYLGPSARSCCYQVGEDVAHKFESKYLINKNGSRKHLDLISFNQDLLNNAGITNNQIEISGYCTICNRFFHSYRRDKEKSGRMMAVIGMRN
ncbi:MAG: peptidoglycan editing factor PgeF [Ignavibacteriales bacterium]|nr:peptidoglycan editing factor PgeF [Ignavibacteriales bacterium]